MLRLRCAVCTHPRRYDWCASPLRPFQRPLILAPLIRFPWRQDDLTHLPLPPVTPFHSVPSKAADALLV